MKNKIYQTVIFIVLISINSCGNQNKVYEEEELFFKYLDTFFEKEITSQKYLLQTYRTESLCKTCRQIPLDTVLHKTVSDRKNMPLYVLFDSEKELLKAKAIYGNAIQYLCGNDSDMDKYGIPKLEPLLLTIDNKKIIKCEYYENYAGDIGKCVIE